MWQDKFVTKKTYLYRKNVTENCKKWLKNYKKNVRQKNMCRQQKNYCN